MPDYSKCVIYKLCCKDLNIKEIYIGSTCNFSKRKCDHKKVCNNKNSKRHNLKVYKFIRDNGGFENWDMILVEEFSCENKMQKLQRERYWYEELKADLNSDYPGRSKKEWREDNKEHIKESKKEYYEANKEQILVKDKERYEANKEQILIKEKKYREANKEKINEYNKTKVTCECGVEVSNRNFARHKKNPKHLDYVKNKDLLCAMYKKL